MWKKTVLWVSLINIVLASMAHPVQEGDKKGDDQAPVKARQETDGAGELVEIGTSVGSIVNGVLTGNVGDIFKGTLPFIDDGDVQTGVGTIFDSLTKPLNTLWASGNKQTLKYFGITEATSPRPVQIIQVVQNANGTLTPVSPSPAAINVANAAPPATPAPIAVPVPTTEEPDDGDESERRLKSDQL